MQSISNTTTPSHLNTTTIAPTSISSDLIGYFCLFISSVLYGGNNLPVKHYDTGDGMFFQLVVAISIWTTGLIVQVAKGFPQFYALPLLGGFFWTTGNCCTVPVIKCIGIGVGSLFWNIVGLIFGWAYGRFGWFGISEQKPTIFWLNYLSISLAVVSTIVLMFVKVEENKHIEPRSQEIENGFFEKMNSRKKRFLGIFLSIFAGIMYALCYEPQTYLISQAGYSQDNNDYAFSLSCGIFLSSLLYFMVYCVFTKNKPKIYPEIVLPCFVVGWLWGIANTAYFISANKLSQAIAFPIANSGPSIVAFILGLIYKEIKGFKNLVILYLGLGISLLSVIGIGISK